MKLKRLMAALTFVAAGVSTASAVAAVDPTLPEYQKTTGVAGNLSSVGSDSLANLMTLWAEAYKKAYPNVNIQIQAAGSSTAPPALTEGTSNLGPMSRPMKDSELQAFEAKHGYKPTAVPVATPKSLAPRPSRTAWPCLSIKTTPFSRWIWRKWMPFSPAPACVVVKKN